MKKLLLSITLFFLIFPFSCFSGGPIGGGPVGGISGGPVGSGSGGGSQLLKTGQTTSYHADDDGDLELGITHSFTVLTIGQYAGFTNITVNSKTHATSNVCVLVNPTGDMFLREVIQTDLGPANDGRLFWEQYTITGESVTFNAAAKTITAAVGNPFSTDALCVGRVFTISGTVNNNGDRTVAVIVDNVITTSEALVNEGPIATDFASVDDLIWDLKDQANAESLAGYTDWRIPNRRELGSIINQENTFPSIDALVFPSTPSDYFWTSCTSPTNTNHGCFVNFNRGHIDNYYEKKELKYYIRLVR